MNDPAAPDSRPPEQTAPDVSLVICTYNRADLLTRALESACRQAVHPYRYEILVVDNNSTDHTRDVVARFQRDHANLRYLHETRVGLSHARNRGWQEARAAYVAYTDDDCILPPHWLAVALEIIHTLRPDAFGGPFHCYYNSPKPYWYKDSYWSRNHGCDSKRLADGEYLWGNNMIYRRTGLARHGGFDARLGPIGSHVGYGDEGDLQRRMRKVDEIIVWYDPRLYVYHLVREDQMTWRWIIQAAIAKGYSGYLLSRIGFEPENVDLFQSLLRAAKTLLVFSADAVYGAIVRDREQYPHYENYFYERVVWRLGAYGRIAAQLQTCRDSMKKLASHGQEK